MVGTDKPASRATAGTDTVATPRAITRRRLSRIRTRVSSTCSARRGLLYERVDRFGAGRVEVTILTIGTISSISSRVNPQTRDDSARLVGRPSSVLLCDEIEHAQLIRRRTHAHPLS